MFAFGYLLVPFYEQLCKATGLRDIDAPDEIGNTQIDATRTVRLELDANVSKLPWQFRPDTPIVEVHPGQLMNLLYEVENTSDRPMTGQAVPSYGPPLAARVFQEARMLLLYASNRSLRTKSGVCRWCSSWIRSCRRTSTRSRFRTPSSKSKATGAKERHAKAIARLHAR